MKNTRGFTLIELMITIVVLGIIVAMAFPSFQDIIENRRVKGAAEEIYAVMMNARSQSLKKSADIRVSFSGHNSASWAWGFTDKAASCDPAITDVTNADACTIDFDNDPATNDPVLKRGDSSEFPDVVMTHNFTGNTIMYDRVRGIVDGASGRVTVADGARQISVVVSLLGRARLCEPDDSTLNYYDKCSS